MHFEVPKAKTVKEFGGEYLMIVISILTALALEQGAQAIHHRMLASEASERIDAEIRANLKEVQTIHKTNKAESGKLLVIAKALLADIKGKVRPVVLKQRLLNEYKDAFEINISLPTLRHDAWEAAMASQAVNWISEEKLKHYSAIYSRMHDLQSLGITGNNNLLDGPRMLDTFSNARMGLVTPQETFRMINQMVASIETIDENLATFETELKENSAQAGASHSVIR